MVNQKKWQAPPCGGRWCYVDEGGDLVAWVYSTGNVLIPFYGECFKRTESGLEPVGKSHALVVDSLFVAQDIMVGALEKLKTEAGFAASGA